MKNSLILLTFLFAGLSLSAQNYVLDKERTVVEIEGSTKLTKGEKSFYKSTTMSMTKYIVIDGESVTMLYDGKTKRARFYPLEELKEVATVNANEIILDGIHVYVRDDSTKGSERIAFILKELERKK